MRPTKANAHPDAADILLRVSSRGQADEDRYSLPTQEAACRAFAEARGWAVHAVQQDAISGEYIERPGFQAVLADLAHGLIGRVIVFDVDRAGRDTYVGATLLHTCKEAGATLHVQQMPDLDLTTPFGEAMFFFRLTQAAQELASTRERTQRGRRARVADGKIIVAPVPLFGYQYTADKSGYEPHPIYAPIVERIYEEVAAGLSLLEVCRRLNAEGIPTRSQASAVPGSKRRVAMEWTKDAVSAIIQHPAYSGSPGAYRHQYEQEVVPGAARPRWKRQERAATEVVPLPVESWPPLASSELAARARARLEANQRESARRLAEIDQTATLLRGGYAFCLQCGRPMTTRRYHRNGTPKWAYRCPDCGQSAYSADIDEAVWAHVIRLAQDETVAASALARWHRATDRHLERRAKRLETARAIAAEAEADCARLLRAIAREDDEKLQDKLRAQWREAEEHLEKAVAARDTLEQEQAHDPILATWADLQMWTHEWCQRVSRADYQDQRQALHRLGLRVFIWLAEETTGRAIRLHQEHLRQFTLVLGWPHGVMRAVPWLCEPLRESEDQPRYLPGYFPTLQDDRSEVALLMPEREPGKPMTLAGVTGRTLKGRVAPDVVLGTRLGEALPLEADPTNNDTESDDSRGDDGVFISSSSL